MGFLDKVGSFLKREAKDIGEAAEGVKDSFDKELTKREAELKMTPSEKIAALQRQAAETDAKFDSILDKAEGKEAVADATAEVGNLAPVTHTVTESAAPPPIVEAPQVEAPQVVPTVEAPQVEVPLPDPPAVPVVEAPVPAPEAAPVAAPQVEAPPAEGPAAAPVVEAPPVGAPAPAPQVEAPQAEAPQVEEPQVEAPPVEAPVVEAPAAEAAEPEPATKEPVAPVFDPGNPDYGKTPAQLKYERARGAANSLLDELRSELKAEGEI